MKHRRRRKEKNKQNVIFFFHKIGEQEGRREDVG
jgi:hypothetical protein